MCRIGIISYLRIWYNSPQKPYGLDFICGNALDHVLNIVKQIPINLFFFLLEVNFVFICDFKVNSSKPGLFLLISCIALTPGKGMKYTDQ